MTHRLLITPNFKLKWVKLTPDAEMLAVDCISLLTVAPQLQTTTIVIRFTETMFPSVFHGDPEITHETPILRENGNEISSTQQLKKLFQVILHFTSITRPQQVTFRRNQP